MPTLANVILSARTLVGDGPTSNLIRNENMDNSDIGNVINGQNTLFGVVNFPITPGGLQSVIADSNALVLPAGYTVNEALGQVTVVQPPSATMYCTYYFYLMDDTSWTEFVSNATEWLNLSTGEPATDVAVIVEGLQSALKAYACSRWCMRMSSQTGLWYNQRLQERQEDRENVSKKFLALAQEWTKQAQSLRDGFYSGSGTQMKPSMKILTMVPRQYTPKR
jgi:hypothetical protein